MSAAKLLISLLGTDTVKSLAVDAAVALLSNLRNNEAPTKGGARSCRHCPWGRISGASSNERRSEVIVPGRARLSVPGLLGNPQRAGAIEATLSRLAGVAMVRANHRTGRALVCFDPAVTDLPTITRALREGGLQPAAASAGRLELVAGSLH